MYGQIQKALGTLIFKKKKLYPRHLNNLKLLEIKLIANDLGGLPNFG